MQADEKKYDLDLAQMADEALVILAQECAFEAAVGELLLRYYEPMSKFIALKARQAPSAVNVEDAQQNGVFAIREAIDRYDTQEVAKPRGCSFRTYVYMVVLARFRDFVKHVRRVEKRYRSLEAFVESPADPLAPSTSNRPSDPADVLAQQEAITLLQKILDGLDDTMRELWHELANGKKLSRIAHEQGISYDQVKRQRRRLLKQLTTQLRDG